MKKGLLLIFFAISADVDFSKEFSWDDVYPPKTALFQKHWVGIWIKDFFNIWKHTISLDTVKVLSFILPAYFGLRTMDKDLQSCFYDASRHKNLHQVPRFFRELSDAGIPAMIGILATLLFWSNDQEIRLTSFIYGQAAVAYWVAKNIFKDGWKGCHNLRPRNERFPNCDAYGGFPSGHAGEAILAAVLFGLRHGPAWGVPLGLFSALVFGISVDSNRHYISQVVGGVGLGLIFGLASYRVIQSKLPENWDCQVKVDDNRLGLNVSYSF